MIGAKKLTMIVKKWQKISFPRNSYPDKGHCAVYSADRRRFVVPLAYLDNPVFRQLLEMSEEEYGLPSDGPIVIPCDSLFMDLVICLIRQGQAGGLNEALLARRRCSSPCLHEGQMKQEVLIH